MMARVNIDLSTYAMVTLRSADGRESLQRKRKDYQAHQEDTHRFHVSFILQQFVRQN